MRGRRRLESFWKAFWLKRALKSRRWRIGPDDACLELKGKRWDAYEKKAEGLSIQAR